MTKEEEQEWEDGGDPCQVVVKVIVNGWYSKIF
jgi:hypothetical protein